MWFIIIFGSIPVLRPFFIRFAQSIKTATGNPSKRSSLPTYLSTSRTPNDVWVQLEGKPHARAVNDSAKSKLSYHSRRGGESKEEIMPPGPARDRVSINEGYKGLVPNNYGSTKTVVEHLPTEKSSAGKWQELQREGSTDKQIKVTREFNVTYEDQSNES